MRPLKFLRATGAVLAVATSTLIINVTNASASIMPMEPCSVWAVFESPPLTTAVDSSVAPTSFQTSECPASSTGLYPEDARLDARTGPSREEDGTVTRWIITLPNFVDELPLKKIWLSIFTNASASLERFSNFRAVAEDSGETIQGVFEDISLTDFGLHAYLTFMPNPDWEIISFICNNCGPVGTDAFSVTKIEVHTVSTAVPEPGTLALFGLGLAGLGFARRRKSA